MYRGVGTFGKRGLTLPDRSQAWVSHDRTVIRAPYCDTPPITRTRSPGDILKDDAAPGRLTGNVNTMTLAYADCSAVEDTAIDEAQQYTFHCGKRPYV